MTTIKNILYIVILGALVNKFNWYLFKKNTQYSSVGGSRPEIFSKKIIFRQDKSFYQSIPAIFPKNVQKNTHSQKIAVFCVSFFISQKGSGLLLVGNWKVSWKFTFLLYLVIMYRLTISLSPTISRLTGYFYLCLDIVLSIA